MKRLLVACLLLVVVLTTTLLDQFAGNSLSETFFPNSKSRPASKIPSPEWSMSRSSDSPRNPKNKPSDPLTSYSLLQRSPAERPTKVTPRSVASPQQQPIRPVRFEYIESHDEPRQIPPSIPTISEAIFPKSNPESTSNQLRDHTKSSNKWSLSTPSDPPTKPINKPVYPSTTYGLLQRPPAERIPQVTQHSAVPSEQQPIQPNQIDYPQSHNKPRQNLSFIPITSEFISIFFKIFSTS